MTVGMSTDPALARTGATASPARSSPAGDTTGAVTADQSPRTARGKTLALFLLTALVLLVGSRSTGVFDRDEARFALAVREMSERGDWILPTNWGELRTHKPILAYWCALLSQRVLGANPLAWRLPSALAGLVALGATMALARRHFGAEVALRAGALLASALVFVVEARILTADALLLATTTLAYWAWFELARASHGRRGWQLLFWTAVAFGVLAKGVNVLFLLAGAAAASYVRSTREPDTAHLRRAVLVALAAAAVFAAIPPLGVLGPVLVGLVAILLLARRSPARRVALGSAWGVPLSAALVAVWFVPALVRSHGAFLTQGVGHHMLARGASAFEGHAGFPGYYLVASLLAFFPWALRLPAAMRAAWRDPSCEFLLAWILGPWALLEGLASKLPHYLLPLLPAVAIVVAVHGSKRALARPLVLAWALYLALGTVALPLYQRERLAPQVGAEVARRIEPDEAIYLLGYAPASLGCELPAGHAVVRDPDSVARALARDGAGLYVVAADRVEELLGHTDSGWDALAQVRGLDGLRAREVAVWRHGR